MDRDPIPLGLPKGASGVANTMTEDQGSTNGAHGGVGHLLRMAKTSVGSPLAFAALRKADGGLRHRPRSPHSRPTRAGPSRRSTSWSARRGRDPHLSGGTGPRAQRPRIEGHVDGPGPPHQAGCSCLERFRGARSPLGILCVAEPWPVTSAGPTEPARQPRRPADVLPSGASAGPRRAYRRSISPRRPHRPHLLRGPSSRPTNRWSRPRPSPSSRNHRRSRHRPTVRRLHGTRDVGVRRAVRRRRDEHPLDLAADAFEPVGASWGATGPSEERESRSDDWEFLRPGRGGVGRGRGSRHPDRRRGAGLHDAAANRGDAGAVVEPSTPSTFGTRRPRAGLRFAPAEFSVLCGPILRLSALSCISVLWCPCLARRRGLLEGRRPVVVPVGLQTRGVRAREPARLTQGKAATAPPSYPLI